MLILYRILSITKPGLGLRLTTACRGIGGKSGCGGTGFNHTGRQIDEGGLAIATDKWLLSLLAIGPASFIAAAIYFGLDANWDLRNYHYYIPYAFLNGRFGFDIAVSQLPTFYNPILYVPFYWLIEAAPPKLTAATLAAIQGLNVPLLYLVGRKVLAGDGLTDRLAAAALAVFGVVGVGSLSEIGTSFFDNVLTLFFFPALLALLGLKSRMDAGKTKAAIALALASGLLIGLAVGLKLTMAIYGLGLGLGVLAVGGGLRFLPLATAFGLGAIVGTGITGGHWMWVLWQRYENPFFPYFNGFFQSSWAPLVERADTGFRPRGWIEALIYPWVFTLDSKRVSEIAFIDARILFVYGAVALSMGLAFWRRIFPWTAAWIRRIPAGEGHKLTKVVESRQLMAVAAGTYFAWILVFAVYRYLISIEMLAPLIVLAALDRLAAPKTGRWLALALCFAALVAVQENQDWGRRAWPTDAPTGGPVAGPAASDYFGLKVPVLADPSRTMVLIGGWHPAAYVIPKFPMEVRFLRVQGFFTGPQDVENRHNGLMQGIVAQHDGPLFGLFAYYDAVAFEEALVTYDLEINWRACATMPSHLEDLMVFCELGRRPG